jgi:hypothetical protein
MARSPASLVGALLAGVLLAACGAAGPSATVGMVNATTIPVAVHVNGAWVGTFPAWSEQREIVVTGHGGPPWHIEFFGPDAEAMGDLDASPKNEGNSTGWWTSCGQFVAWFRTPPMDIPPLDPAKMQPASPPCS